MARYYTPGDRDRVLQWLTAESHKEQAFVGAIVVGSGAVGFTDEYSDLDILVVVTDSADLPQVSQRWKAHLLGHLPVLAYAPSVRADRIILHNFYLTNYLEINNCVLPLELLSATRANYRVLWDRTDRMQSRMDETWNSRRDASPLGRYSTERQAAIWHYINHAFVAIRRGRLWQALSDIEDIREQAIHLHAYRERLEPKRNRDVDTMDEAFRRKLSALLVGSLTAGVLLQSLTLASRLFFEEARSAAVHLGIPYTGEPLETAMLKLLAGGPDRPGGHT